MIGPTLLILVTCVFIASVEARAETKIIRPSDRLLEVIPELDSRLQIRPLLERIKILNLLADPPRHPTTPAKLHYKLSPDDYEYVLDKCVEALNTDLSQQDAEALLVSGPLWVDLIQRFKLEGITKEIAELLKARSQSVQFFALLILGALDAREYEAEVANLLTSDQNELKRPVREILLRWNSKKLTPLLVQELTGGSSFQRSQAISALRTIADPTALPALLSCGSDPSEYNRKAVLEAVRTLSPVDERPRFLVPLAREIAQNSSQRETVGYALAISIDSGDADAVPAVMSRLTANDEGERQIILNALEGMSVTVLARAASAALVATEQSRGPATERPWRGALVGILKRIGTPEVIPALRVATADPDLFIQAVAISALGDLRARDAVEDLRRALLGQQASRAAVALAQLRDKRTLTELKLYLQRPGALDNSFVYHLNEAYNSELDRRLKTTLLKSTIEALPDELFVTLAKEYGMHLKLDVEPREWTEVTKRTGKVSVYANVSVDNSVGRVLNYINQRERVNYCHVLRAGEVHIMRTEEAPQFIAEMFVADFY